MTDEEYISIGKITGVHGLFGKMKVQSWSDSMDLYEGGRCIWIKRPDGVEAVYTISKASPHKKRLLLMLDGVVDIDTAQTLRGSELRVPRSSLPPLEDDEYYWRDIIGLRVFLQSGESLGAVTSIFPTGSNDVYVVKNKDGERLIPALASVIVEVDLSRNVMIVDLPEGL